MARRARSTPRVHDHRTHRGFVADDPTPDLLVGAVWAAWHLPLYLVWTSSADMGLVTSLPMALYLPLLFAGLMAAGLVYGELRVRTGSIWPGVVLHTMSNVIATPLLVNGHVTFEGHADVLFSPIPSSIVTMVLFGVTGLALVSLRHAGRRRHGSSGQSGRSPGLSRMPTT